MLEGKDLEQAIANYKSRYKKEPYQPLSTFIAKLKSCIFNSTHSADNISQPLNSKDMEKASTSEHLASQQ